MAADYRERGIVLPEGAVRLPDLTIGGKTPKELEEMLDLGGIRVSDYARDLLRSPGFTTLPDEQAISLVRVKSIGILPGGRFPTLSEILRRAGAFGLGEYPPEVAVYLRLADKDQPLGITETYWLANKPIIDKKGESGFFRLAHYEDGLLLDGVSLDPLSTPAGDWVFSPLPPRSNAPHVAGMWE